MFFVVNSQNRLAVRKLLTSTGMDSAAVRVMRNGELGMALRDACVAGKVSEETARLALTVVSQTPDDATELFIIDSHLPIPSAVAAPTTVGATLPADAAAALRILLGVETPKVDESAMRRIAAKLVREEMVAAGQRPAVIEIRTESGLKTRMDGKATHKSFATCVKVVNTRVAGKRLHVMMVGPSGSGKTHLGRQVAEASGLDFYMTGAVKSPFQLLGFVPANFTGESKDCPTLRTPLRLAYQYGGVFAWDEIDASDAGALVCFNALLDGGDEYAFPDGMVKRHADFVCVASANTWGTGATADFVGRTKLDGATLSRFQRVSIGYDETLERDLVGPEHSEWVRFVQAIRRAVDKEGIKVLITPRHSLNGAALLAAGIQRDEVEGMTVFAGLDTDTVSRLRAAA